MPELLFPTCTCIFLPPPSSDNRASPVDAKVNFEDEKKAEPIAEEQETEQPEEALPEE